MTTTLGGDPGHDGGSVLLDPSGRRALLGWGWRRLGRIGGTVYRLCCTVRAPRELDNLFEVGLAVQKDMAQLPFGPYHLVVEGFYVPSPQPEDTVDRDAARRYTGRAVSVVELGEAAALFYGPLLGDCCRFDRVLAAEWRHQVLDLAPSVSSEVSEERAIRALTGDRPLVVGLGELATDPHVAEAAAIAVWGHRLRQPKPQQRLFGSCS